MKEIELWALIQGNKTQKAILVLLRRSKALHQSEIARRIKKSQPTVHHHIDFLLANKLVQLNEIGKYHIYFLTDLGIRFTDQLIED